MRVSLLAAVPLLVLFACKHHTTRRELYAQQRPAGALVQKKIAASVIAIQNAPAPAAAAACARVGLVASGRGTSGNTDLLDLRVIDGSAAGRGVSRESVLGSNGAALYLAQRYEPHGGDFLDHETGDRPASEDADVYAAASKVDHLLVAREADDRIDIYLVDLATSAIECSFAVTSSLEADQKRSVALGYDPRTGDAPQDPKYRPEIRKDLLSILARELKTRFGLKLEENVPEAPPPTREGPLEKEVRERAALALRAVDAAAKVPSCKGKKTVTGLRLTRLRLALAAGSELPSGDPDVRWDYAELSSPEALAYLRAGTRESAAGPLLAAPVWSVVDVVEGQPGFDVPGGKFRPGSLTARQVLVDHGGVALCETKVTVTNSETLEVRTGKAGSTAATVSASSRDLIKNLGERLASL